MSEMVERMAVAIRKELHAIDYGATGTGIINLGQLADTLAPLVIKTMREPTEAMAEAIWAETGDPCWKENAVKAWQAGIDEALK